MTLKKLLEILVVLKGYSDGVDMHGSMMVTSAGSELALDFSSQPDLVLHRYLIRKRFVLVNDLYIYRP
jgi:hypothetical protein